MTRGQRALVLLDSLGPGILAPVLSLILFAHGCSLGQLGLALGCYSGTVLLLELPSGVASDLLGRRRVYFLACGCSVLAAITLLLAQGFAPLLAAMALQGAGRALSSGTMDALLLDQALRERGEEGLNRTTSSLLIYQCAGTAAGALAGGFLPGERGFCAHLLVRAALLLACVLLAVWVLPSETSISHDRPRLLDHLRQGLRLIGANPTLRRLLLLTAASAIPLCLTETYWQSALLSLPRPGTQSMLGLTCTLGFSATILGSWGMGRLSFQSGRGRWIAYALLLAARAALLALISLKREPLGFVCAYLLSYLALGAFNIPEQTLLNASVPSALRATMLSLYSLAIQLGCMLVSLASSPLVGEVGVQGVWRLGAALSLAMLAVAGLGFLGFKRRRVDCPKKPRQLY